MTGRRRGRRHGHGPGSPENRVAPEDSMAVAPVGVVPVEEAQDVVALVPAEQAPDQPKTGCTAAQMRRFIKSRPYVPLHELRRRFGIEGTEDDVSSFDSSDGPVYVGLPSREAQLLGELVRSGEVGYELLLDPTCPAIVGVFPMRPVART